MANRNLALKWVLPLCSNPRSWQQPLAWVYRKKRILERVTAAACKGKWDSEAVKKLAALLFLYYRQ